MTFVTGCSNPRSVSILIRGGTEHVTQEVERSLQDALKVVASVLEDGVVCPGGGATEIELAVKLRKWAPTVGGREQLAVEAFAQSLEAVPWALAENGGYDSINTLIGLRSAHDGANANKNVGVNLADGKAADMWKLRVIEPPASSARRSARRSRSRTWCSGSTTSSRRRSRAPPRPGGGGGHDH